MFNRKVLILFLISFFLFGCKAKVASFTEKQNGKTVVLKTAEQFMVSLKANPTTGYFWSVNIQDEKILTQNQNYQYESDSNLTGAGGKVVFFFQALGTGKTDLTLSYQRPFEEKVPPLKTYKLSIVSK